MIGINFSQNFYTLNSMFELFLFDMIVIVYGMDVLFFLKEMQSNNQRKQHLSYTCVKAFFEKNNTILF